jgi:hypothetical protein
MNTLMQSSGCIGVATSGREKSMRISEWANLSEHLRGREIVGVSVGFDRRVYVLLANLPTSYRELKGGASFAKVRPPSPQSYRVVIVGEDGLAWWVDTPEQTVNFHDVQPLPDGNLLFVCARSHYRGPNDYDLNACILSEKGELVRQFLLGDGIQDVQVDKAGNIWTSFFDEGVFGNFGWRTPVGAPGLILWDAHGNRLYQFVPPPGLESICDCYAINVTSAREIWVYYYTEFPLVRLWDRTPSGVWSGLTAGSSAFAVLRGNALFTGGYKDRETYYLYTVQEQKSPKLCSKIMLETMEGQAIHADRQVGRFDCLYVLSGICIYKVTVGDCMQTSPW